MNGTPTPVAIVGLGKIATDQHIGAIARSPAFCLAATVDPRAGAAGVPHYPSVDEMLRAEADIRTVALCVPPQVRYPVARAALAGGCDVLLEKPPGITLSEVEDLAAIAARSGRVLYATWHSRHAGAVPFARDWIAERTLTSVEVSWREDARKWHPGQDWLWKPGGMGVFDTGINALSILTEILPAPLRVTSADFEVPENLAMPIAARLTMTAGGGIPMTLDLDFRNEGAEDWTIRATAAGETLVLASGGHAAEVGGIAVDTADLGAEYDTIYAHFAELLAARRSDVDLAPMRLVADAFLVATHRPTEPFDG